MRRVLSRTKNMAILTERERFESPGYKHFTPTGCRLLPQAPHATPLMQTTLQTTLIKPLLSNHSFNRSHSNHLRQRRSLELFLEFFELPL